MSTIDLHYKKMTETPVSKLIIKLGIPTTVSMLITSIYNLADTYFVGTLGESAQGAIGILFTLQCIIQAFAFMFGHGSGVFVAKKLADKDVNSATNYASTAFFSGIAIGSVLTVFGLIFLTPFMLFLGSSNTILPYAKEYGACVLITAPLLIGSLVLNNCLRYEGKAFYAMIGLTSGGILNIFGDFLLVKVFKMGVLGAGIATAVSQTISFILLVILYFKFAQSKISLKAITLKAGLYYNIIRVGFPSFIRQGLTSVSGGILNNLAKPYGDALIAAMSVVNKYTSLIMFVGLGVGQGFQPVASFNYEAKKYDRVKNSVLFTAIFGLLLVSVLSLPGVLFPEFIISVFQKKETVITLGAPALRYASIGIMLLPISIVANMLFQSTCQAAKASFLALMRSGLAFIPTIIVLETIYGVNGILIAQPIADVLSTLVAIPFLVEFLIKINKLSKENL